jgi:PTH1 family peptidyl-tRNA hydrolase
VSTPLKLIVGLGNPGSEYLMTRHNAGFWFIDALASRLGLTFNSDKKFNSETCRYRKGEIDCWLCKPQTYMNESGTAVQAMMNYYKIAANEVLVVHDEIDLDAGMARFKIGGGHGGQNGLRDIIQKIGGNGFNRLRIGVGHPGDKNKVVSYVLNRPGKDDEDSILDAIASVLDDQDLMFEGEIQRLMNNFNKKKN